MYEVELMSFVDYKAAQEYDSLDREEKDKMSVAELVDVTNSLREVRQHTHSCQSLLRSHRLVMICLLRNSMLKLPASTVRCVYMYIAAAVHYLICTVGREYSRTTPTER